MVDPTALPPNPLCEKCETNEHVRPTFITKAVMHWLCIRCGTKWQTER